MNSFMSLFSRRVESQQASFSDVAVNEPTTVDTQRGSNESDSTNVNNLVITDSSASNVPSSPFVGQGPDSLGKIQDDNDVDQNAQNGQARNRNIDTSVLHQHYQNQPLMGPQQNEPAQYVSDELLVAQLSINRLSIGQQGLDLNINLYKDLDPPVTDARLKGVGGFGKVYKSTYNKKPVAVKVFNIEHQMPLKLPEMDLFMKELNIICRLKHKYIVECYGACLLSGDRAIIMEYVDYSLYEYIHNKKDQKKIELKSIYVIIKGIAKALQFLHYNKIIHRDLHPKNVLLTRDGCVKVGDFGISRMVQTSTISSLLDNSNNDGPPQYLAPKLFSAKIVPKSDIYSLGTIAWEMYTGTKPWADYGYGAIMRRVQEGERLPLPPEMPKELKNIITKCWEQQHRQRPTAKKIVDLCRAALRRLN